MMHKYKLILFLSFWILGINFCAAQNLVLNGSFDSLNQCPSGISQLGFAPNWNSLSNHLGSPDYFHSCAPSSAAIHVPNNAFGTQAPYTGNAYSGEAVWSTSGGGQAREYMMTPLLDTLEAGRFYRVSFYYSVAEMSRYFIAGLGVYFSDSIPQGNNTYNPLNVTPQLVCTDTLTNLTGWSKIAFNYQATGNERYMTIGNFNDNAHTPLVATTNTTSNMSYLYFDEVVVEHFCMLTNQPVICPGDSVYIHAQLIEHGSIYGWATKNNPTVILSTDTGLWVKPNVTTSYLVYSSCDTQEVVVMVNDVPNVNLGSDTILCKGRSLQLKAPPNQASYIWHNNSTQSTCIINDTGTYWVWVSNGICVDMDTIHIGLDTPKFNVNIGADTTLCIGSSYTLKTGLTSSYYHLWSTGVSFVDSISVSATGKYSVLVFDGSCYNYDTVHITFEPPRFKVDLGPDTFICSGEIKTLDAGFSNATYIWQDSSSLQQFEVTESGFYFVDVERPGFACKVRDSVTIVKYLHPMLDLGQDTSICVGTSITLSVLANIYDSIIWNNQLKQTTFTTSDSGRYFVKVFDGNCYNHDTIHVSLFPKLNVNLGQDTAICKGSSLELNTNHTFPNTFLWSNNQTSSSINIIETGLYWVSVFDGNCFQYDTIKISLDTPMFSVDLGPDKNLCEGDSIKLDAVYFNASYLWNNGSLLKSLWANQSGVYTVTLKRDEFTCAVKDSIKLVFYEYPQVDLDSNYILCEDSQIVIDLRNNNYDKIEWQDGKQDSIYTISKNGLFRVKVTSNDCSSSDSILIITPQAKPLNLLNAYSICKDIPLEIDLRSKLDNVIWNDNDTNRYRTFINPGTYTLNYVSEGCFFKHSFERINLFIPTIHFSDDTVVCDLSELVLDPKASNADNYLWQDGSKESKYKPDKFGLYSVTVSNTCGSTVDSMEVLDCSCEIYIPTAFTPSFDQLNEVFKPEGCAPLYYHLLVYNRWGQQVFESYDFNQGWDGKFKGEPVLEGQYVWIVEYAKNLRSGAANRFLKGTVMLLR